MFSQEYQLQVLFTILFHYVKRIRFAIVKGAMFASSTIWINFTRASPKNTDPFVDLSNASVIVVLEELHWFTLFEDLYLSLIDK